jgi:hypothetical protein
MKKTQLILGTAIAMLTSICSAENNYSPLSPKEYAKLHNQVSHPKDPDWAEAMKHLAKDGDAFTVEHLKTVKTEELDPTQSKMMKETLTATADIVAKEDAKAFTKLIEIRLERAAIVDANCDPLEMTLVLWTHKIIRQHLDEPGVTAELKRIQSDYVPKDNEPTSYSSMQKRVRSYAGQLLSK